MLVPLSGCLEEPFLRIQIRLEKEARLEGSGARIVVLAGTGRGEVGGDDLPDGIGGMAEWQSIARSTLGHIIPEMNPEVRRQDRGRVAAVEAEEGTPPADFHDGIGGGADPVIGGDLLAAIDRGFHSSR